MLLNEEVIILSPADLIENANSSIGIFYFGNSLDAEIQDKKIEYLDSGQV